jgi:hypothetical protein
MATKGELRAWMGLASALIATAVGIIRKYS